MASTQESTVDSFEFSSYVEEDPRVAGATATESSAVAARATASVNQEETTAKPRQANDEFDDHGACSIASQGPQDQLHSIGPEDAINNSKSALQHSHDSGQSDAEPVKPKKSHLTPPVSVAPASSYSLRNRTQSKLVYDVKYHPMDDAIRPSQAAKRRSAHGEEPVFGSGDPSEASITFETDASDEESSDAQSEEEENEKQDISRQNTEHKERKQTKSRQLPTEGTRRSARKVSGLKTSYNMDIHPQDKYLVISSDDDEKPTPSNKRKKLTRKCTNAEDDTESKDEVVTRSTKSRQKRSRRAGLATSEELDSGGAPVLSSIETVEEDELSAPTTVVTPSRLSSAASPPGHGIRRREGMDVWHYPPGKRYFNHDRDYWPVRPGEPFEIFEEKLEDQLAREVMEASPLNYEHDDKENTINAGLEPLDEEHDRFSVIPVAQYRQSSDERQLADHRALVSSALYSDEAPQSYGLDGTHNTHEIQENHFSSCMDILASGQFLPPGRTQPDAQTETQDSVLGPNLISDTTGSEL